MQPPPWNNRGPYDSLGDPQLGSSTSFRQKRTLCAHTGKVGPYLPVPRPPADDTPRPAGESAPALPARPTCGCCGTERARDPAEQQQLQQPELSPHGGRGRPQDPRGGGRSGSDPGLGEWGAGAELARRAKRGVAASGSAGGRAWRAGRDAGVPASRSSAPRPAGPGTAPRHLWSPRERDWPRRPGERPQWRTPRKRPYLGRWLLPLIPRACDFLSWFLDFCGFLVFCLSVDTEPPNFCPSRGATCIPPFHCFTPHLQHVLSSDPQPGRTCRCRNLAHFHSGAARMPPPQEGQTQSKLDPSAWKWRPLPPTVLWE